jgi:alkylated DNA repair dioxygenase AlkB
MDVPFQPSLFEVPEASFDHTFSQLERIWLDADSWVDFQPGWVSGSDALFEEVLAARDWGQRTRWMYQGQIREPRLTSIWTAESGEPVLPLRVEEMRLALGAHYDVMFDSVGFNLYRDGRDSVAWHGDKIRKEIPEPIVPLVSLGEPRKFLMRPKGGGISRPFHLGRGDLLVTGGRTHRAWEHTVPKVAHAGPRISIAFRYGLDPRAYTQGKRRPVAPEL